MKYNPTPLVSGLMTVLAAGALFTAAVQAEPTPAAATYELRSGRKPGHIDRVTALLEVGGHVTEKTDGKIQRKKMSVVCSLSYHERTLEVPGPSTAGLRSVRFYDQAAAVVKKIVENEENKGEMKLALRPQRRLIGVQSDTQDVTLFGPRGPLSRDELELLDIQGNSLLLDRFLPEKPVAVGDTWRHSAELMAALLCVDQVATADVQSTLSGVTGNDVRIEMTGRVEGAVDGVTTEIDIKAKYRFDLGRKRIDWFALLIKEVRNASPVANGVDAVARVQVQVTPAADSPELTDPRGG